MIRKLLCRKCGDGFKLHPEDEKMGWKHRGIYVSAKTPQGHGLTINGTFHPLKEVMCDNCSKPLEGDIAVAVTQWREDGYPGCWEQEYGRLLTPQEVLACDLLAGKEAAK